MNRLSHQEAAESTAAFLSHIVENLGVTREDAAQMVDLTAGQLRGILLGRAATPSVDLVRRMALAWNFSASDFYAALGCTEEERIAEEKRGEKGLETMEIISTMQPDDVEMLVELRARLVRLEPAIRTRTLMTMLDALDLLPPSKERRDTTGRPRNAYTTQPDEKCSAPEDAESHERSSTAPRVRPGLVFTVDNHHFEACGEAPAVDANVPDHYYGYFENCLGEQAVFVCDYAAKKASVWMGDCGWEHSIRVVEGTTPGFILDSAEAAWLRACWQAAILDRGHRFIG